MEIRRASFEGIFITGTRTVLTKGPFTVELYGVLASHHVYFEACLIPGRAVFFEEVSKEKYSAAKKKNVTIHKEIVMKRRSIGDMESLIAARFEKQLTPWTDPRAPELQKGAKTQGPRRVK